MVEYDVKDLRGMSVGRIWTNRLCIVGIVVVSMVLLIAIMIIASVCIDVSGKDFFFEDIGAANAKAMFIAMTLLLASLAAIYKMVEAIEPNKKYSENELFEDIASESVIVEESVLLDTQYIKLETAVVDKYTGDITAGIKVVREYSDIAVKEVFTAARFAEIFGGYDLNSAVDCNSTLKSKLQFIKFKVEALGIDFTQIVTRLNKVNDNAIQKEELHLIKETYAKIISEAKKQYMDEYYIQGEKVHSEIMNDLIKEKLYKFEELSLDLAY